MVSIRPSTENDVEAVCSIYAHEVLEGRASFEITPPSVDEMITRRKEIVSAGLPYLVAERENSVLGYAYAAQYRARPAYRHTLENSVYVAPTARCNGVAFKLMNHLIKELKNGPWSQVIAVIGDSANTGSIRLHSRMGFEHIGVLKKVGYKHGQWLDTVLMQLCLADVDGSKFPE